MGGTVNMKLEQRIQIFEKILFQKNVLISQAAAKKEGVVNQGTSVNKKKELGTRCWWSSFYILYVGWTILAFKSVGGVLLYYICLATTNIVLQTGN